MICSSEPSGMMRGSTASASKTANGGLAAARSGIAVALSPVLTPSRATRLSYGTTRPEPPRSASARQSSSVCQPDLALRITTSMPRCPVSSPRGSALLVCRCRAGLCPERNRRQCIGTAIWSAANAAVSRSRRFRGATYGSARHRRRSDHGAVVETLVAEQRGAQHLGIETPGVERPPGHRTGQPDFGRAEQHRIDLIEVVVVAPEDVVERRAVIIRRGRGQPFREMGQLLIVRTHGVAGLPAV